MRRVWIGLIGCGLASIGSLLLARVHPFGDAGLHAASRASTAALETTMLEQTLEHASVPPGVRAILVAKCADCHSLQTRTPFYGRFAPASWLMERDIVEGRKKMNLSLWGTYSADQQQTFAAKMVQETRAHEMPPPQYRLIHWDARISDADIQGLSQWAHQMPAVGGDVVAAGSEGDPMRGKALYEKRCTGCHAMDQNHEGPKLQGVYGRASGEVAGYPYSDALKKAHVVWDDASLNKWLTDPDAFLPGNNMDFLVPRPQERKDIISYFKQGAGK